MRELPRKRRICSIQSESALTLQRLQLRRRAVAQHAEIAADGDEAEAAVGQGEGAFGVAAIDAGNLAGLGRGLTYAVDRALDLRSLHILRRAAAQRRRQVVGADEQRIDAGR